MTIWRYIIGYGALVALIASLGLGALGLRRTLLPTWQGAAARLAESVLAFALVTAVAEGLGTVGLFRLGPIVVTSLVVGIGFWFSSGRVGPAGFRDRPRDGLRWRESRWSGGALLVASLVLVPWAAKTLTVYDHGMLGLDSLWFHLPWAAWYAQSGQVATVHYADVQYLSAFYPATGELFHGMGIVLMGNDLLSPLFNLVVLAFLLLAAWCIGSPRGLGAVTVAGATLSMTVVALFNSQPGSADTDTLGVFFLMAAVALWLNATSMRRSAPSASAGGSAVAATFGPEGRSALAVAGIAAGLAVSVRLNLLAPVLVLSVAVIAIGLLGRRRAIAGVWMAAVTAAGGFWYVRNLVSVGNPLPWFGGGVLPTPHAPLMQRTEFAVSHYLTDASVWRHIFIPALRANLGPCWLAILAIGVVGALLGLIFGPSRSVRAIGFVTLCSVASFLVTPGTAAGVLGQPRGFGFNLRYAAPALTLALTAAPLARPLCGRRMRWITMVALLLMIGFTLADLEPWRSGYLAGAVIAALLLLIGGALSLGAPTPHRIGMPRLAAALGVAVLGAIGAGGYAAQQHYLARRYASLPNRTMERLWNSVRGLRAVRIGLGGTGAASLQYPLWGADDSNDVEYIAQRGAHGSFVPIDSCQGWRRAVDQGHYRYVVTAKARDAVTRMLSYSPESAWTLRDPGAQLSDALPAQSWILIFKIVRPLNPAGC